MFGCSPAPGALSLFALFFLHLASAAPRDLQESQDPDELDTDNGPPSYSLDFMKELCRYVGVSYVRNPQDPLCKYVWCWNGYPFTMECSPGRTVHPYFYWSERDPCTEPDVNEQCLLRVLKRNTWIPKIERAEEPRMLYELDKNHLKDSMIEEVHLPVRDTGNLLDKDRSFRRDSLYVTMSPQKAKQSKILEATNRNPHRHLAVSGDLKSMDPSTVAVSLLGHNQKPQDLSEKKNMKFYKHDSSKELNTGNIYLDSKGTKGAFNTAREYLIQDDRRFPSYY